MDDVAELHAFHRDLLRDGPEPGRIHALAEVPLEVAEEPEEGVEFEVVGVGASSEVACLRFAPCCPRRCRPHTACPVACGCHLL